MNEVKAFAKDRRLYHLHAATFIIGFLGILAAVPMTQIVLDPRVAAWFGVGAAVVFTISGVLAVAVKRTMFSKSAEEEAIVVRTVRSKYTGRIFPARMRTSEGSTLIRLMAL